MGQVVRHKVVHFLLKDCRQVLVLWWHLVKRRHFVWKAFASQDYVHLPPTLCLTIRKDRSQQALGLFVCPQVRGLKVLRRHRVGSIHSPRGRIYEMDQVRRYESRDLDRYHCMPKLQLVQRIDKRHVVQWLLSNLAFKMVQLFSKIEKSRFRVVQDCQYTILRYSRAQSVIDLWFEDSNHWV